MHYELSNTNVVGNAILRRYFQYLRLERSYTPNTLDAYLKDLQKLLNYEEIKGDLQIRLCDAKQNTERLKDLVSIPDGDYAMTFQVCMGDVSGDSFGTVAVTQALLGSCGNAGTPRQLGHQCPAAP